MIPSLETCMKFLFGVVLTISVVVAAAFGLEYAGVIATFSVGVRQGMKWALGVSGGILLYFGIESLYSLYKASKNKDRLKEAVDVAKKAVK
jgi:threonine/homoserine/homoserine lactone efflux protein